MLRIAWLGRLRVGVRLVWGWLMAGASLFKDLLACVLACRLVRLLACLFACLLSGWQWTKKTARVEHNSRKNVSPLQSRKSSPIP